MKVITIFVDCLYTIEYSGSDGEDEYRKVFNFWSDTEKLHDFFERNIKDLENGHYGTYTIEEAAIKTLIDAREFEEKLLMLAKKSIKTQYKALNSIFEPLSEKQDKTSFLIKSKTKQSWLRLYALKTENDDFIITGGAIKLTETMNDRKHLLLELKKLESIRKYLLDHGIKCTEDIVVAKEF